MTLHSTFNKSEALRFGIYLELTLQTVKSGKYAKQKKILLEIRDTFLFS